MSFFTLVCVVLWGMSAIFVQCVDLSEEYRKHAGMVAKIKFPCNMAQPRVFYLQDLVNATEWKSKYEMIKVQPKWTILYRCTSAGCCEETDKRCLPSNIDEFELTFSNLTETRRFFQISVTNHTQCSCLSTDHSGKDSLPLDFTERRRQESSIRPAKNNREFDWL